MTTHILDKQCYFVTGKGGVGKSLMSLALAKSLAREGKRTLWLELAETSAGEACFDNFAGQYAPTMVEPNLFVSRVTLQPALEEYMHIVFKIAAVANRIAQNEFFRNLTSALPGMESLVFLGKIEYELNRTQGGRRYWDAVVFDAPATGHALTLLRFPTAAADIVPVGPVLDAARRQERILADPNRCAIIIASLAEELPVTESLELAEGIRECGFRASEIWLNSLYLADPHKADFAKLKSAGVEIEDADALNAQRDFLHGWYEVQQREIAHLDTQLATTDAPPSVRRFPYIAGTLGIQSDAMAELISALKGSA